MSGDPAPVRSEPEGSRSERDPECGSSDPQELDRGPPGPQPADSAPEGARSIRVVKHSIVIAGHRTSVSLEEPFWRALKEIAAAEGASLAALVAQVDEGRGAANLSSALRVFVLEKVSACST